MAWIRPPPDKAPPAHAKANYLG
jgi:heme/copper-type cytochrome/quinol oxidase subunit 2